MHALKIENQSGWGIEAPAAGVRVGGYLEGLYRTCRPRHDADTCNEIVDDTYQLLSQAGFGPLEQISHEDLAAIIFASTRAWEYIGEVGTIALVQEQREYTRTIVGDVKFLHHYEGMETLDGRSYFAPIQ